MRFIVIIIKSILYFIYQTFKYQSTKRHTFLEGDGNEELHFQYSIVDKYSMKLQKKKSVRERHKGEGEALRIEGGAGDENKLCSH